MHLIHVIALSAVGLLVPCTSLAATPASEGSPPNAAAAAAPLAPAATDTAPATSAEDIYFGHSEAFWDAEAFVAAQERVARDQSTVAQVWTLILRVLYQADRRRALHQREALAMDEYTLDALQAWLGSLQKRVMRDQTDLSMAYWLAGEDEASRDTAPGESIEDLR